MGITRKPLLSKAPSHYSILKVTMNYLWILAFCLCGGLATPIIKDETSLDQMATELEFVEEIKDEVMDRYSKIVDPSEIPKNGFGCGILCKRLYGFEGKKGKIMEIIPCKEACRKELTFGTDLDDYSLFWRLCGMISDQKENCLCVNRIIHLVSQCVPE